MPVSLFRRPLRDRKSEAFTPASPTPSRDVGMLPPMNSRPSGIVRSACRALLFLGVLFELHAATAGEATPPIPANERANPATRALLAQLRSLPSQPTANLIVGQHCGGVVRLEERHRTTVEALAEEGGRRPALIGGDFIGGFNAAALSRFAAHSRRGGFVTLCWHAPNPWTGGPSDDLKVGDFTDLLKPGTPAHAAWQLSLSRVAGWLGELRDAGVVVLWRPFHEMNLPGSHWWASRDQPAFIAVWRQMFDRFSRAERLDNLLWVYSPNAEFKGATKSTRPAAHYYPGTAYVDVTGLDFYTRAPLRLREVGYTALLALGKPMALCEFGPRGPNGEREPPDRSYDYRDLVRQLRMEYPEIVYFMAWMDGFALARQIGAVDVLRDRDVRALEESAPRRP